MNGQLELARRPHGSTCQCGLCDDHYQSDDLAPARRDLFRRFAGWVDPTPGKVGTGGAVARGLVCVLLCLAAALAMVGALTGLVVAVSWIASLL